MLCFLTCRGPLSRTYDLVIGEMFLVDLIYFVKGVSDLNLCVTICSSWSNFSFLFAALYSTVPDHIFHKYLERERSHVPCILALAF
jgi:hypothetical protein